MTLFDVLQYFLALLIVLGLIAGLAWLVRRTGAIPGLPRAMAKSKDRRLAVVETLALDTRRRLVLVRRDGVEHLLLLGAQSDAVVETAIPAAQQPDRPEPKA